MGLDLAIDMDDRGPLIRLKLHELLDAHSKALELDQVVSVEGTTMILGGHLRLTITFDPLQILEGSPHG